MPLISEQLNNLRNEITVLKNQNVSFLEQKDHSAIDKSEAESRALAWARSNRNSPSFSRSPTPQLGGSQH